MPFCDFLGRFKKLRYLRVISSASTDLLHTPDGQRSVLASLIEHCPTLRNVTLNGEIHALHPNGKWLNVEDIVEILEKQQREAIASCGTEPPPATVASRSNPDEPNSGPAELAA